MHYAKIVEVVLWMELPALLIHQILLCIVVCMPHLVARFVGITSLLTPLVVV